MSAFENRGIRTVVSQTTKEEKLFQDEDKLHYDKYHQEEKTKTVVSGKYSHMDVMGDLDCLSHQVEKTKV